MNSERAWLENAKKPPEHYTRPDTCTREDLFRELDYLIQDLGEEDKLFDSRIRRRVTRIRALASTLLPKQPNHACGYEYPNGHICTITARSKTRIEEHRQLVHEAAT